MAFDAWENENEWKAVVEEMSAMMVQMAKDMAELRQAVAPLLGRHQRQEELRLMAEERDRLFMQAQERLGEQYALMQTQLHGAVCDCSPTREAYLNNGLVNRVNDFFKG